MRVNALGYIFQSSRRAFYPRAFITDKIKHVHHLKDAALTWDYKYGCVSQKNVCKYCIMDRKERGIIIYIFQIQQID